MKRDDTPAKTTPARTVFRFTDAEVHQALLNYLAILKVRVPAGIRGAWVRDPSNRRDEEALVTLVIDHEPAKDASTPARGACRDFVPPNERAVAAGIAHPHQCDRCLRSPEDHGVKERTDAE